MNHDSELHETHAPEPTAANQESDTSSQPDAGTTSAAATSSGAAGLPEQRARLWHQAGSPIQSIEAAREWIGRSGLVLYAPRPQGISAPAPSFVEATLGTANATPSPTESEAARSLLTRLVAEGSVVPLNLMGAPGGLGTDMPDFLASAAVFPYIFTLRGNKAWKQPPETSGALKVSPLAVATYEMLSDKVTLSSYDLATQLGKEVTEAAVLRALTELWTQLRVLPVPQTDGSATLWELLSARFTKQIKSGANAGQPSALSALISLYLGQAVLATEDDVESFLSPIAPRSRVRGVVRDLTQARQLETLVIAGKTLLHVAGDAPAFATDVQTSTGSEGADAESGSRIAKFKSKPGGKLGTGLRAKPFTRPERADHGAARPAYGKRPSLGQKFAAPRERAGGERERRPFDRTAAPGRPAGKPGFDPERRSFSKPWNEDRRRHDFATSSQDEAPRPRRNFGDNAAPEENAPRRAFQKPGASSRNRESFRSGDDAARPPRREFREREDRPEKSRGGEKRPFTPRPGASDRGERTGRSFNAAGTSGGEAPPRTFRKFDAPRGKRPFDAERPQRRAPRAGDDDAQAQFRPRRAAGFGPRPTGEGRPERAPRREGGERGSGFGAKRPGNFGEKPRGFAGRGERPAGAGRRQAGSFNARPNGPSREGEKERPAAGRGGQFAKFGDGKKPFRKGSKPAGGKPGAGSRPGGFKPVRRKRPEGGA